jgi:hypothetical protein
VRFGILVLACGFATAGIAGSASGQRATPGMCLALKLTPGEYRTRLPWGLPHHPPDTVALDTASSIRPREDPYKRVSTWRTTADSLFMSWTSPFYGLRTRGVLQDSVYRGIAIINTDVRTPEPLPKAGIEGRVVICPERLRR